ncbi:MAG: T9SS type A sorting domain-containing protein [Calditrichae bacterium]|nr:T9SS type A sorting domain-containing protein [Calditrichia bacterium]
MLRYATDRLIQHLFSFLMGLMLLNSLVAYAGDADFKTEGEIQSIGSDSLVVNNYIFDVDSYTEIKGDDGDLYFNELMSGDFIKIEGQLVSGNRYYAEKIERKTKDGSDDSKHELETKGYISMISAGSLEVNGYSFEITAETAIKSSHGINVLFEQLKTGMLVEVKGFYQQSGTLYAVEIELEDLDSQSELEFYGHIDSVLNDAIIINQKTIAISNATLIRLSNHQLGSLNDLKAGQFVEVKAAVNSDGSLVAVRIKLEDNHENEIEIAGRIDSVGAGFIKMLDYRVEIDDNTVIMNHAKALLTPADLEKGQRVEVKSSLVAEQVIQASRIKVKRFHENELEFTGQVTMVASDQIQVEQTVFNVTETTAILDNQNQAITLDQIQAGQFVEIKGYFENDGSITAVRIKIEDRGQDEVEFTGQIESLTVDQITVSGVTFAVNDMTVVFDLQGNAIIFSDLNVDDLVEIKGLVQADGTLLAVRIKMEDTPALIVVSGEITAVSDSQIQLSGPQFILNQSSVLLDAVYHNASTTDFNTGESVTIWALKSANGNNIIQAKLNNTSSVTSLENVNIVFPEEIQLHANYPNPFNPETQIAFTINKSGFSQVQLEVFDITGRKVKTLFSGLLDRGNYSFKWNGTNTQEIPVASGMFIYRLRSAGIVLTKKMTLIR